MNNPQQTGTAAVQATLTQQWLFNLQNMVATLIVEPALLEEPARPIALTLMKAGVARLEALESMREEKETRQQ